VNIESLKDKVLPLTLIISIITACGVIFQLLSPLVGGKVDGAVLSTKLAGLERSVDSMTSQFFRLQTRIESQPTTSQIAEINQHLHAIDIRLDAQDARLRIDERAAAVLDAQYTALTTRVLRLEDRLTTMWKVP